MTFKPGINEVRWMAVGAALVLGVLLVVLHFQKGENPAEQLELKARRLELVNQIRLSLASAAEAEKSAVMAITDADSQIFAEQARAATAAAEQGRRELERLLATSGTPAERNLLSQFTQEFTEFQRVDKELLDLAVRNTNLKASSLAFGPASAAINELDAALARLPTNDLKVVRLVDNARIAALRVLALLPPHIAEESDQKMDEMETQMAQEDRTVRRSLDELAALPHLAGNDDVKAAAVSYARFDETRAQILKLSRENTNVRSLTISLSQKRKVMSLCQDTLAALQQAIQNEPIPATTPGTAIHPRAFGFEFTNAPSAAPRLIADQRPAAPFGRATIPLSRCWKANAD